MKFKLLLVMLFSTVGLLFTNQIAMASTEPIPVLIYVKESDGTTPVEGVAVTAKIGAYWYSIGTTDSNGKVKTNEFHEGTFDIKLGYNGSIKEDTVEVNNEKNEFTFETTEAKVQVNDTNGDPLKGAGSHL